MKNTAILFSGQGAQRAGMGKWFYDNSPAAKDVFERAEKIRPGTIAQCFEGTPEELSLTLNTQPCLYCVDFAAGAYLSEAGVEPVAVAGFSLGELAAISFAGVFTFEQGFEIVMRRAELMHEAAEKSGSAMAAVLKLDESRVLELCAEFSCYPANYNCPGQTVVSLSRAALPEFTEAVKKAGGRAVPLPVSGGFHSPYMDEAASGLRALLHDRVFKDARLPVYSNRTATPYGTDYANKIANQVNHPVLFQATVENMARAGITQFIEAGVGNTLVNFVKKTCETVVAVTAEELYAGG